MNVPGKAKSSRRTFDVLAILAVCLIGVSIYAHTLDVPFYFDDNGTIVKNPLIRSLSNFKLLWKYDPSRIVTHYSFAMNFHFGGLGVQGYHIVNVALHLLTSLCFFYLLRATFPDEKKRDENKSNIIVFCALLFLTHPVQTQAVTYISQRSTVLASLCYLGSILFYVNFRRSRWQGWYIASLFCAFAGLFTKPIIITLPFALILYEMSFLSKYPKQKRQTSLSLLPYFVLALCVPLLLMLWRYKALPLEFLGDMTRQTARYSRYEYLLTQFNVIMTYLRLLFLPVNQSLDYDYPVARSFFEFPTWLSFCVLCGLFFLAVRLFKGNRAVSFGIFWMFLTLSLESSIFPIADVIFEHRLYLPMAGFAMIAGFSLTRVCRGRSYLLCATLIIIAASALTYARNQQWRDILAFHKNMVQRFPGKVRLHNNIGNIYMEEGDVASAKQAYLKAIELAPKYYKSYNNIANVCIAEKDFKKAAEYLHKAIELNPSFTEAYINLGNIYLNYEDKNPRLAGEYYMKALNTDPYYTSASVGLGRVFLGFYDFKRAKFYLRMAINVDPTNAVPYAVLGDLYVMTEEYERAAFYYQRALALNPDTPSVMNNLGNVLDILGRREEALDLYLKAIEIDPDYAEPYLNLADIYLKEGDKRKHDMFLKKGRALKAGRAAGGPAG